MNTPTQDAPTDPGKRTRPTETAREISSGSRAQGWRSLIAGGVALAAILALEFGGKATSDSRMAVVGVLALQIFGKDIIPILNAVISLRIGQVSGNRNVSPE